MGYEAMSDSKWGCTTMKPTTMKPTQVRKVRQTAEDWRKQGCRMGIDMRLKNKNCNVAANERCRRAYVPTGEQGCKKRECDEACSDLCTGSSREDCKGVATDRCTRGYYPSAGKLGCKT